MLRIFINKVVSRIARRSVHVDNNMPFFYIVGVVLRYAVSLLRSLKYLPFSGIKSGFIFVGNGVVIRCCSMVGIEKGVKLGDGVYLDGYSKKGLSIGAGSSIGSYSRLICSGSIESQGEYIHIGSRVGIGEFSRIGGSGGVFIGDDTIIAQYFSAHPENHNFSDKSTPIRTQGTTKGKIYIGENCWIGAKVTITSGVRIGSGVVIGSGAVVTTDLPDYCVAAGVPARVVRMY